YGVDNKLFIRSTTRHHAFFLTSDTAERVLRFREQSSNAKKTLFFAVLPPKFAAFRDNNGNMLRDISSYNSFDYGDPQYWDVRYVKEANSFDWYQQYSALRPLLRKFIPTSSSILMVGCGNAVISEDMVKDGYEEIVNVDISSVAIDIMKRKYEHIPQLKYLQMDARDMNVFTDESFDSVIDKGTLDALMCGADALTSSSQMLNEVSRFKTFCNTFDLNGLNRPNRLLKPGGFYILVTYGDPTVRMACLKRSFHSWQILLHVIPRPGFQKRPGSSSTDKSSAEAVPLTEDGLLPQDFVLEDPDCHFIYVCQKSYDERPSEQ
ncbi:hypothetical protein V2J09_023304, partial [Rumex salicifolius]